MLRKLDDLPWGCYGLSIEDAEGIIELVQEINTNAIVNACDEKENDATLVLIMTMKVFLIGFCHL